MEYRVTHRTFYQYSESVSLCHNEAHLVPRSDPDVQTCHSSQVLIEPSPAVYHEREDFFGNPVVYFAIQEPHYTLEVTACSRISLTMPLPHNPSNSPPWEEVREIMAEGVDEDVVDARPFRLPSPFVPTSEELAQFALNSFTPNRPVLEGAREITYRLFSEFMFDPTFSTIATPVAAVLQHRRGVCQDFAHLAIAALRSIGLAARYVSGYIETLAPPGQPRLIGVDASHAWLAVFVPGMGWVEFDPTNNLMPHEQHIRLAWGRDFADVTPLKGVVLGGGSHGVNVSVDVERLPEVRSLPPALEVPSTGVEINPSLRQEQSSGDFNSEDDIGMSPS